MGGTSGRWWQASWSQRAAGLAALLAVLCVSLPRTDARRPIAESAKCGRARVGISVSPLIRSKEMRILEVLWRFEGAQPGDQVALYDYDPVCRKRWQSSFVNRQGNEPLTSRDFDQLSPSENPCHPHYSDAPRPAGQAPEPAPPGNRGAYPTDLSSSDRRGPGFPLPDSYSAAAAAPYDPYAGRYGPGGGSSSGGFVAPGQGSPQYPPPSQYNPYNGWGANPGGGSPFPIGYPRESFSGRARRRRRQQGEDQPQADDPNAPDRAPLALVLTNGMLSGWVATNVQEKHVASSQLGYTPRCLNYWVAYERPRDGNTSEVLAVSCLRTRPTWMADNKVDIGRLRLVDLFIPGTHDSASVQENGRNNIIDRYTVTQDESILGQLIYGVRYIDLRVGFYPNKDVQWWANHGPVRMQPLLSVLHDIKAFMANTNEIVILDIQNFPAGFGKDNKVHLKLVHLLETELGELMAYRDQGRAWGSRLDDLWSGGRRLIVAYDKEDVLPASRKLWPAVRQFWGDAQTSEQLNTFATSIMSQQNLRGFMWALMAELTPNARLIATNPTGSLRRLAHQVNRNVTAWAEGKWGEIFNTLAVDFIRSTGVVEAAIFHNLRRAGVDQCNAYLYLDSQ